MKIKCGKCGKEDQGAYYRLLQRGWAIVFYKKKIRIDRCKNCKPILFDRWRNFKKFYSQDIAEEIKDKEIKMELMKSLK